MSNCMNDGWVHNHAHHTILITDGVGLAHQSLRFILQLLNGIDMDASLPQLASFLSAAAVDQLDFVILSALEIDTDFNVNVLTGSDGVIRGAMTSIIVLLRYITTPTTRSL